MPPWHADPKHGKFANERKLSDAEKKLIGQWVKNGTPEGDPKDLPKAKSYVTGWQLPRQPDMVLPLTEKPFAVPQIVGEHRGGQALRNGVLHRDGLVQRAEGHRIENGRKRLSLNDRPVRLRADDRGFDEVAWTIQDSTAVENFAAFALDFFNGALERLQGFSAD